MKFSDDSGHWFIFGRSTCSYHRFLEFITRTSCYRTTGKSFFPTIRVARTWSSLDFKWFDKKKNIQKKTDGAEVTAGGDTKEENGEKPQPDVIPEKARRRVRKDD